MPCVSALFATSGMEAANVRFAPIAVIGRQSNFLSFSQSSVRALIRFFSIVRTENRSHA